MECDLEIGEVEEIKETKEGIEIGMKFKNWKPTFTMLRGNYDIKQLNKLKKGTKVYCIFKNSMLLKIFLEPLLYNIDN